MIVLEKLVRFNLSSFLNKMVPENKIFEIELNFSFGFRYWA